MDEQVAGGNLPMGIGNRSNELGKLFTALSKVQGELEMAKKTSENPFFHSKYADLAECLRVIYPITSKYGISFIQLPCKAQTEGHVALRTMMCHDSGQFIEETIEMLPKKGMSPQEVGICISYMRRYSVSAFCGIAQEDTDANDLAPKKKIKDAKKNNDKIKSLMDNCESVEDLQHIWSTMDPDLKPGLEEYKDTIKKGFGVIEEEKLPWEE